MEYIFNRNKLLYNALLIILTFICIFSTVKYTNKSMALEWRINTILFKESALLFAISTISGYVAFQINNQANLLKALSLFILIAIILILVSYSIISHQIMVFVSVSLFTIPSIFSAAIIYVALSRCK